MDSNKTQKQLHLGSWGLVILSIFSCLARPDFNILCGCALLILLRVYCYRENKLALKISIHLLVIMLLFDLLWIFICFSSWTHGSDTSEFWQSLSFMHNVIYIFGLVEFLLKCYLAYLLFGQFKQFGTAKDLINFKYQQESNE